MCEDEAVYPPCPCCGKPLDSPWTMDHFIDCRERLWHWECAGRVLGADPAQAELQGGYAIMLDSLLHLI